MKQIAAILLMTLCLVADARAQAPAHPPAWQLQGVGEEEKSTLSTLFPNEPLGFGGPSPLIERPRLSVSLSPAPDMQRRERLPTLSWSLEAWEMKTASLAHIQCSRATRTIESFVVEDCRFVDQPLPDNSGSLVQVQGRWMAAPGLTVSGGAYAGRQSALAGTGPGFDPSVLGSSSLAEDIQGVNMNVSFGLSLGQVGSLLLDLQLERYRKAPESFSLSRGLAPALFDRGTDRLDTGSRRYSNAGQLGLAWRGSQFGADLTGQYQELPYWMGEQFEGQGFRSFDIELSWRAPARSSISVGVSNVLDRLPGAAGAADQNMEEAVDGIYGRIPYVRYKHDL